MTTEALRTKKVNVRRAHRASATRSINQLGEAIEFSDIRRLRQAKQFLTNKLVVLEKLDNEVLELVEEDYLEGEVEQADETREKIDLAILTIEDALEAHAAVHDKERDTSRTGSRHRSDSSSSASDGEDERPDPLSIDRDDHPVTTTSTSVSSVPATSVTSSSISSVITTTPSSLLWTTTSMPPLPSILAPSAGPTTTTTFPSISSLMDTLPHPMGLPTSIPLAPPILLGLPPLSTTYMYSGHSGVPLSTAGLPSYPAHGMLPSSGVSISHTSLPFSPTMMPHPYVHPVVPQVKLPKLSIKRFNGDLTKWVTFWDSFNSSIHSNPSLSSVDKFNYLMSFVESSAAEAIAGLTITSANYDEAIATLKKRFGNPQLIVNRHMEALLGVTAISSHLDIKGLRKLHDTVEAHIRGLRALGVPAESYGGLLTSVLVNKLPSEIRLIVSREMTAGKWDLDGVMKILEREVEARERTLTTGEPTLPRRTQFRTPTGATLFTNNPGSGNGGPSCVYCGQGHTSTSCTAITDVTARKDILRKTGRCYICLRRNHISRNCRSGFNCRACRGRHHITICSHQNSDQGGQPHSSSQGSKAAPPSGTPTQGGTPTSTMYVGAQTPILLQTAKMQLFNPVSAMSCLVARAVMDSGSQRTYVTNHLRDQLNLPTMRTESLQIKTFGATETQNTVCDVVELGVNTEGGEALKILALVVPSICDPLAVQPINYSKQSYDHLIGLELADSAEVSDVLEIDMLIGSDLYWDLVTGQVVRGDSGPMAIHTKVGWVLSGPTNHLETSVNLTLASTHTLKIDVCPSMEPALDDCLKRFWDLESLGIVKEETSVYDKFVQKIRFDGHRYEVCLPWKEHHPPLLDHRELCRKRLMSLLKRLRQTPQLLTEYNMIIQDQLEKGIVEIVTQPSLSISDSAHYLPHHGVVRQDKSTSRLRIVYDASAKSTGPSLNECLYTGPKFGQSIFDIVLRFRLHQVALAGDIEKAFLMLSMHERDRDSLRFLWASDPHVEPPEIVTLRFARVAFGVSSSPFLLNATIKHHVETYRQVDSQFVDKFLSSIYVDDLVTGSSDVESTYEFYKKSRQRLAVAGFRLRKFITNSDELRCHIQRNESQSGDGGAQPSSLVPEVTAGDGGAESLTHAEEDQSYAKSALGTEMGEEQGVHKILGVEWNVNCDNFQFEVGEVATVMEGSEPTKRSVVSATAKFFDPLGIVSPVTILFKIFAQQLCEARVSWDEPLTGDFLKQWKGLLSMLRGAKSIAIPRCLYSSTVHPIQSAKLVGFCDASSKAYAAITYLRLESEVHQVSIKFVAAKTRVAPVGGTTIPRLELLSALLLSKLINSVHAALEPELQLGDPVCFSDSKVVLFWIQGTNHEWKQFVENRVNTIRSLVGPQYWKHCPGKENPADIPSRGMRASELADTPLWLHGPEWLHLSEELPEESTPLSLPEECRCEMKRKDAVHSLVTLQDHSTPHLSQLIDPERYSSTYRLFRVTGLVLKFIRCLRSRVGEVTPDTLTSAPSMSDFDQAKLYWIKDCQARLQDDSRFTSWKRHLDLFMDKSGVWRCGGRMSKSCLSLAAQNPILLDKNHHLTKLIVTDAHLHVIHSGTNQTLTELRSEYWLIKGRQFVRKLIHGCIVCKKREGKPCQGNPPPPLPEYRVQQSRPFQTTGVDFAGPFYVKTPDAAGTSKVWLCLYTCCASRAVHLDLVADMTATTFIRSFRRFAARRGMPSRMISDNAKTFKSASKIIRQVLESPEAEKHFAQLHVEWKFNLEKAPWWGGIFERMIKSAKRCLRKSVGKNCLSHDELLTLVIEVEAVLNSRPLTYISSEDMEEPLTPSHLLVGYRILTLPDPSIPDDPDYSPEGLTRRMSHLSRTLQHFWNRWKKEYLLELREFHRTREERGSQYVVKKGDVVTVYDEGHPRGLWRLGKIESLVRGSDGVVRGVHVRVMSRKGRPKILRRPLQHIYPLEVCCEPNDGNPASVGTDQDIAPGEPDNPPPVDAAESTTNSSVSRRPVRRAATQARDRILGCVIQD